MKKKRLTVIFTVALLFSAATLPCLVELAWANPIGMLPRQPEPLVVTIKSPSNGSRCFQEQMSVTFILQNPTLGGADSLTYAIDGQAKGNINGVVTSKEGERFVGYYDKIHYLATINLTGLSDGLHTLKVNAAGTSPYNPEGGMKWIYADVNGADSIQFLLDIRSPSIEVLLPQNTTYTANEVPLNFVLSEQADWIGCGLDEQIIMTLTGNTTLTGLSEGSHSLTVYANDTVGRNGASETVYFTIKKDVMLGTQEKVESEFQPSEPFPTTTLAVAIAIAAIVIIGALLYIKKRSRRQTP